jgi:hypothetical protein
MNLSTSSNFLPSAHYLLTRFHPTSFINLVITDPEGWAHLGWMGPGCTNGPGPIYNQQTSSRGEGVRSFDHSCQYLFMS